MKTVVDEPQVEYKVASWQTKLKDFSFDDFIFGIENETVIFCPPSSFTFMIFSEKPKKNLSALRGRLSKQSRKEIDDQISNLRSEWERNI